MTADWYARADEAAVALRSALDVERVDAVVVLGSGWAGAADAFGTPVAEVATADLPHFLAPVAVGHAGLVRRYDVAARTVVAFLGRTHLYEGHGPGQVVHAVRTAAAAGARVVALTNANGSFRADWGTGTGVLLADHLNLSGSTPLEGPRFLDLTEAYAPRLRTIARAVDPTLVEGTYVMLRGPHYETVAEAQALQRLGADVVGMSTALETIAARESGLEVLALSVVTVVEASGEQIDPDAVVAAAERAATGFGPVLRRVCSTA
ncbi:MAG: purine-nucleoside phosphorylase [Actinomycetales bacterium]